MTGSCATLFFRPLVLYTLALRSAMLMRLCWAAINSTSLGVRWIEGAKRQDERSESNQPYCSSIFPYLYTHKLKYSTMPMCRVAIRHIGEVPAPGETKRLNSMQHLHP